MNDVFIARRFAVALLAILLLAGGDAFAQGATGDLFGGFGAKSKDPIEVDAKSLEIFEEGDQRVSVFSGSVTVRRGDTILKAGAIKLYSPKKGNSSSFNLMEATGTVYVNSGTQTATGSRAVVDTKAQTITLVGDVVLSQGTNVITGDRLVVDMRTGRAKVEQEPGKKIRGVFTPDSGKPSGQGPGRSGNPGPAKPTN